MVLSFNSKMASSSSSAINHNTSSKTSNQNVSIIIMIQENVDITRFTTFGVPARARYFAEYSSADELLKLSRDMRFIHSPILHIGGGSNLLFFDTFDGLVLHSNIRGMVRYDKNNHETYAIVGAGEKWTDFVDWTLDQGLAGVENLAGIPGEVGASPVQNVGAYGVEAGDVIFSVECFDLFTRNIVKFSAEECSFGYRDSFFKHEGKNRYIVLRVSFRLTPDTRARHLDYGPLTALRDSLGHDPYIREVAEEVKRIRDSKLPDPALIGSAGSFFKNPVVHRGQLGEIKALTGHELSGYPVGKMHVKLSAAWLIDHAGMKGAKYGGARVYDRQPLVIVNTGNATAHDVATLAQQVRDAVRSKFLIDLSPEVNYIDSKIHVTMLGTGTSKGIPEIGCKCPVCTSPFIYDKRTRTSALIRTMGQTILIDVSPDFRQQALAADISHIDAVLLTHSHYDHVGGIDDLRPYCAVRDLPIYTTADVEADLRKRYDYCFKENPYPGVPTFDIRHFDDRPFCINGLKIVPITVMHGPNPITSFRIGDFAYITDAKTIDEENMEKLRGVRVMVINALRDRDHFSHFTLEESLEVIRKVQPRQAYLTHFNHEIGRHFDLARRLPAGVVPGHDGLSFSV